MSTSSTSDITNRAGIFVSYRREETASYAGRLYDRLADRFGDDQIFMDVDSIEPGVEFDQAIKRAVSSCRVLLAVIGPRWFEVTDQEGRRRIDDPHDFVRLEVEAALERGVLVIPILVDGAAIPRSTDLPETLFKLTRRNALRIDHESFRRDFDWLFEVLQRSFREPQSQQVQHIPERQRDDSGLRRSSQPVQHSEPATAQPSNVRKGRVVERTDKVLVIEIQMTHTSHQLKVDADRIGKADHILLDGQRVRIKDTAKGSRFIIPDGPSEVQAYFEWATALGALLAGFKSRITAGKFSLDNEVVCTWY